jgi:hypothetical protein
MTMPKDLRVFNFLRGAVRSCYGIENFRDKTFLIIGMSRCGQLLLNRLCIEGVDVKFSDQKVSNYYRSFAVCKQVDHYQGQQTEVVVDFLNDYVCVQGKTFPMEQIGLEPYAQGIHEYYL